MNADRFQLVYEPGHGFHVVDTLTGIGRRWWDKPPINRVPRDQKEKAK